MIAELYGKATGCARGKGGSMHLIDVAARRHGRVGRRRHHDPATRSATPTRCACAASPLVVASFFGDGARRGRRLHESLNFAALKQLPILFVCENNRYAIHTPPAARQPHANIACARRGRLRRFPAERIEDGDVLRDRASAAQRGGRRASAAAAARASSSA